MSQQLKTERKNWTEKLKLCTYETDTHSVPQGELNITEVLNARASDNRATALLLLSSQQQWLSRKALGHNSTEFELSFFFDYDERQDFDSESSFFQLMLRFFVFPMHFQRF